HVLKPQHNYQDYLVNKCWKVQCFGVMKGAMCEGFVEMGGTMYSQV
ncbi:hypothetical protein A2U01_0040007, partial [Trifolium medium]|nr:hypothetical protein [Trifolium medium]